MRRADVIAGAVVAMLGAFALLMALNLAFLGVGNIPGPGFFPTLLSALLVVLGVLLAVYGLRPARVTVSVTVAPDVESELDGTTAAAVEADILTPDGTTVSEGPSGDAEPSGTRRVLRSGTVWLIFLLSVPLLAIVGFVPTMALLVAVLLYGVERRIGWQPLVVAIVIPVGVYELFVHLLSIPLPTGLFNLGPLST
jgi:putative tricarboxylic transport membrane protein